MPTSEGKWLNASVQLVGRDGNAYSILGRAGASIRQHYDARAEKEYLAEAMSGDYNHLLSFTANNLTIIDAEDDEWGDRYEDYDDEDDWDDDEWDEDDNDYDDEDQ